MKKFKTLQELRGYSSIDVTSKSFDEISSFVEAHRGEALEGGFPLMEGVLMVKMMDNLDLPKVLDEEMKKCRFYIYYSTIEGSDTLEILMEGYLYDTQNYDLIPLNASTLKIEDKEIKISNSKDYVMEGKPLEKLMYQYFSKGGANLLYEMLLKTLMYVSIIQSNRQVVYKESKGMNYASSSSTKKKSNYEKVEVLNEDKVMYIIKGNKDKIKTFRTYTRHVTAWNVIGHYRKYKNGNKVWVNGYTKGEGKVAPKKYKVK